MLSIRRTYSLTIWTLIATVLCSLPVIADETVATVTELDGTAFVAATRGGTRKLRVNDTVVENDKIITGKDSAAELTFGDGTKLNLGASTIITVDAYRYRQTDKNPEAEESFTTSIVQGAVRAFTGLLAKRKPFSVKFKTKVATIGIRGTHFVAEVEGDSATIILLAQQDTQASNAIEVSNQYGKVEIDTAGWGTEVPDAASPPSPPRKMRSTQSMNRILRSVQTNRRVRIPRSPIR